MPYQPETLEGTIVSNIAAGDLADMIASRTTTDSHRIFTAEFLGTDDVKTCSIKFPYAYMDMAGCSLNKVSNIYAKSNTSALKCKKGMQITSEYTEALVGPAKADFIPENTVQLLEDGNQQRMILRSAINGNFYTISVMVPSGSEQTAREFLQKVKQDFYGNNALKGKILLWDNGKPAIVAPLKNSFNDLILSSEQKSDIREALDSWINRQPSTTARGVKILLEGPPGTGKTAIEKAMAAEMNNLGVTVLWVSPGQVKDISELQQIFFMARVLYPSLLIFEDIDILANERQVSLNKDIFSEFLQQLDGLIDNTPLCVVASTSRLNQLDTAISNRPGRFDMIVHLALPTWAGYRDAFLQVAERNSLQLADIDWKAIGVQCIGFSFPHIQAAARYACSIGMANKQPALSADDVLASINKVRKSFNLPRPEAPQAPVEEKKSTRW